MSHLSIDGNGFPVLLADVPNAGYAVKRETGSEGGNDTHDARSGKFAPKPGDPPEKESALPNVDPIEFKRMMDAVRDAAREFDFPEEGDIREFLAGRAKNPAQVDVQQFLVLVQEQIKTDLVDALDQQLRSGGVMKIGRRKVRVSAPRGYLQKTLRGLDEEGIAEVMHRLEAKGHDQGEVDAYFDRRVKPDTATKAKEKRMAIAAADDWTPEPIAEFVGTSHDDEALEFAADMAERIARGIQPPVVHLQPQINVQVPETKPVKREIVRGENGLMTGIIESAEGD